MNPLYRPKCDACGRPAVFHETVIQQNVPLETHLCTIHSHERFQRVLRQLPSVDVETLLAMAERFRRERGG
jgi:hypothetical protein